MNLTIAIAVLALLTSLGLLAWVRVASVTSNSQASASLLAQLWHFNDTGQVHTEAGEREGSRSPLPTEGKKRND